MVSLRNFSTSHACYHSTESRLRFASIRLSKERNSSTKFVPLILEMQTRLNLKLDLDKDLNKLMQPRSIKMEKATSHHIKMPMSNQLKPLKINCQYPFSISFQALFNPA